MTRTSTKVCTVQIKVVSLTKIHFDAAERRPAASLDSGRSRQLRSEDSEHQRKTIGCLSSALVVKVIGLWCACLSHYCIEGKRPVLPKLGPYCLQRWLTQPNSRFSEARIGQFRLPLAGFWALRAGRCGRSVGADLLTCQIGNGDFNLPVSSWLAYADGAMCVQPFDLASAGCAYVCVLSMFDRKCPANELSS